VRRALAEDIGQGDVTAALTPAEASAAAVISLREDAVICGVAWAQETFRKLDPAASIDWACRDGDRLETGRNVCRIEGAARAILTGERTALNFLQILSATATAAASFVAAVAGTGATILDTRKTIPGLRAAQKYAVHCGGASNHRFGLFDAILIKENHIVALGSIEAAVARARSAAGSLLVEIEVETMAQVEQALASDADRLLLDNFSPEMMSQAAALRDRQSPAKQLEASGGITLENVREIAETGVDYISVGAMTKSIAAIDFSLRIV
jgi:nicotinate-nucleotide pyrophosphorylase (carboxylating)